MGSKEKRKENLLVKTKKANCDKTTPFVTRVNLTLDNYARLRTRHKKEMPEEVSTVDSTLQLLRMLFDVKQLLHLDEQFKRKFEKLLKKTDFEYNCESCKPFLSELEYAIKKYSYKLFAEEDGGCLVNFVILENEYTMQGKKLYCLTEKCEEVIRHLVQGHKKSNEAKRKGHSTSCVMCRCEAKIEKIGVFQSLGTPMQDINGPNFILPSIDTKDERPRKKSESVATISAKNFFKVGTFWNISALWKRFNFSSECAANISGSLEHAEDQEKVAPVTDTHEPPKKTEVREIFIDHQAIKLQKILVFQFFFKVFKPLFNFNRMVPKCISEHAQIKKMLDTTRSSMPIHEPNYESSNHEK